METSPETGGNLANDKHHHSGSIDEFSGPDSNLQKPSSAHDTEGANSSSALPDKIGDQVPDKPILIFRNDGDHMLVRKHYRHLLRVKETPKPRHLRHDPKPETSTSFAHTEMP